MAHNNKLKLDTTMLQTNTAMHLMAFMLTQRDLVLDLLSIIKEHEEVMDDVVKQCIDQELGNTISWNPVLILEDNKDMKRQIKEVNEDFEYICKLHTHSLHKRTGTKIYKKEKCEMCDNPIDKWATTHVNNYNK